MSRCVPQVYRRGSAAVLDFEIERRRADCGDHCVVEDLVARTVGDARLSNAGVSIEDCLDGAHFGPAFPHLFLQEFGEFDGRREFQPTVLEAFGFPIHKSVKRFEPHAKNEYEQERPTEAK